MNIQTVIADLQKQGFKGEESQIENEAAYFFGIGLKKGKIPVKMTALFGNHIVSVSSVELVKVEVKNLPLFMMYNDLMACGKMFLSTVYPDPAKLKPSDSVTLDYGFEIMESHYSYEVLFDYIQQLYKNLEALVFADQ